MLFGSDDIRSLNLYCLS